MLISTRWPTKHTFFHLCHNFSYVYSLASRKYKEEKMTVLWNRPVEGMKNRDGNERRKERMRSQKEKYEEKEKKKEKKNDIKKGIKE